MISWPTNTKGCYNSSDSDAKFTTYIGEGHTSNTAIDEDVELTIWAPFLEIVTNIGKIFIVIWIQLWRVLIPYFPILVYALVTFYAEIKILDQATSFLWTTSPRPSEDLLMCKATLPRKPPRQSHNGAMGRRRLDIGRVWIPLWLNLSTLAINISHLLRH